MYIKYDLLIMQCFCFWMQEIRVMKHQPSIEKLNEEGQISTLFYNLRDCDFTICYVLYPTFSGVNNISWFNVFRFSESDIC